MKKIFLLTLVTFFGQQVFSQMYIVALVNPDGSCVSNSYFISMKSIDPQGNVTSTCIPNGQDATSGTIDDGLSMLNQELNSIMSQGYKLINIQGNNRGSTSNNFLSGQSDELYPGTVFFLAQPWSSSGLEEISITLNNISVNPNPANSFVDISLDYSIKGKSEVVFINEAGYIIHKESIQGILKNEKYNIDISKLSAGKYLVKILNGKTYTTPQKLIVF